MPKRNWKYAQANNLRDAFDLCLAYALEKQNLSVDRVAELMGLQSKWSLYKWIQNLKFPINQLQQFEHICGINMVSRYLAYSDNKVLIQLPAGKKASPKDMNELTMLTSNTINTLIKLYENNADVNEALAGITNVLEAFVCQQENVKKLVQPDLDF